jgi:hypothetical protein
MFLSRLSDIVEPRGRTEKASLIFKQIKISCQKIEILAVIIDLLLMVLATRNESGLPVERGSGRSRRCHHRRQRTGGRGIFGRAALGSQELLETVRSRVSAAGSASTRP